MSEREKEIKEKKTNLSPSDELKTNEVQRMNTFNFEDLKLSNSICQTVKQLAIVTDNSPSKRSKRRSFFDQLSRCGEDGSSSSDYLFIVERREIPESNKRQRRDNRNDLNAHQYFLHQSVNENFDCNKTKEIESKAPRVQSL